MMKLEVINKLEQFESLEKEWDILLERSGKNSVFLTWEWLYSWWINFYQGKELAVLVARDNDTGELIGVAPFYMQTVRLFRFITVKKIKLLGAEETGSTFMDFITLPAYKNQVIQLICKYLKENKGLWDVIELNEINDHVETLEILRKNLSDNFTLASFLGHSCIYIDLPDNYEMFLMSLGKHTRRNLRKATREAEDKFNIKVTVDTDVKNVKKNVETIFFLHELRFSSKSKSLSNFSGNKIREFHYQVAERLAKKNRLRFYFLKHENNPLACLYTFRYKETLFCYQSGFDPQWGKWSLGDVIFRGAIEDCIKQSLHEFNFLIGDHEYKKHWSKKTRETEHILIMNKKIKVNLLYFLMVLRKRLGKIFKKARKVS